MHRKILLLGTPKKLTERRIKITADTEITTNPLKLKREQTRKRYKKKKAPPWKGTDKGRGEKPTVLPRKRKKMKSVYIG